LIYRLRHMILRMKLGYTYQVLRCSEISFIKKRSKDFYKLTAHLVCEHINFFSITEHYNIKYSDTM
jgi:hypothetical protein